MKRVAAVLATSLAGALGCLGVGTGVQQPVYVLHDHTGPLTLHTDRGAYPVPPAATAPIQVLGTGPAAFHVTDPDGNTVANGMLDLGEAPLWRVVNLSTQCFYLADISSEYTHSGAPALVQRYPAEQRIIQVYGNEPCAEGPCRGATAPRVYRLGALPKRARTPPRDPVWMLGHDDCAAVRSLDADALASHAAAQVRDELAYRP